MMKVRNILFVLCFVAAMSLQNGVLHAQVVGSPVNEKNAIDYRFQYFDGRLP